MDRSTRRQATGTLPLRPLAAASRWRAVALYLLSRAPVLVALDWLFAKVGHDDGVGRGRLGRQPLAGPRRTDGLNDLTNWTTLLSETVTVTVLAMLTVATALWLSSVVASLTNHGSGR
jgi:hypothetical protein